MKSILIILMIPAIIALSHDIYLFYQEYGLDNLQADLARVIEEKGALSLFASLGFIWTRYDEESFRQAVQTLEPETWAIVNEWLDMKAFFAGLAFAAFFGVIFGILRLFKLWPFHELRDGGSGKAGGKFKYKRK